MGIDHDLPNITKIYTTSRSTYKLYWRLKMSIHITQHTLKKCTVAYLICEQTLHTIYSQTFKHIFTKDSWKMWICVKKNPTIIYYHWSSDDLERLTCFGSRYCHHIIGLWFYEIDSSLFYKNPTSFEY